MKAKVKTFTALSSYPKEAELQLILNEMDGCSQCKLTPPKNACEKHREKLRRYFFRR